MEPSIDNPVRSEESADLPKQGLHCPQPAFWLLLLGLSALSIVTLIRVVGIILAIALLTVPAVIARQWRDTLSSMMGIAVAVCAASVIAGLLLSWQISAGGGPSLPPGPLAILCLGVAYAASSALRRAAR